MSFLKKPILVLWEARSRAMIRIMLPAKALSDAYAARTCARAMDQEWGFQGQRVVLRGDGEPALQALLKEIGRLRAGPAAVEVSPPGDHQANGAAEQGIRLAQGYARIVLAAVAQSAGGRDIPENSPLIPYAVRHGAWLYTKFAVGPDGKTPWEALRGKPFHGALAQFGEKVMYLRPEAQRPGKLAQKFAVGVFLGREDRTGQVMVGTAERVLRAQKFLRLPEEEQYDPQVTQSIRGVPWDADGMRATGVEEEQEEQRPPLTAGGGADSGEAPADKRPYLTRRVVERLGAATGCPGCRCAIAKEGSRPLTEECRERLQDALIADLEK